MVEARIYVGPRSDILRRIREDVWDLAGRLALLLMILPFWRWKSDPEERSCREIDWKRIAISLASLASNVLEVASDGPMFFRFRPEVNENRLQVYSYVQPTW